jgi:hypothetical protein
LLKEKLNGIFSARRLSPATETNIPHARINISTSHMPYLAKELISGINAQTRKNN